MPYAAIKTATIQDRLGTFVFELLEKDGSGPATAMHLAKGGSLRRGKMNRPVYEPLRGGILELPLFDKTLSILTLIESGVEDDYRVQVKKNGSNYWLGTVIPSEKLGSLDKIKSGWTLRAVDNIGRLKAIDFLSDTGQPHAPGETATLTATIAKLLSLTGLGLPFYLTDEWYPYASPAISDSVCPLDAIYIPLDRYTNYTSQGEAVAWKALDVLKEILLGRTLQLVQQMNAWHIVQRGEKVAGTYRRWKYDSAGTLLSGPEVHDPLVYSDAAVNDPYRHRRKGGKSTGRPALRSVSQDYLHGEESGEYLPDGSFEQWISPTEPARWDRVGPGNLDDIFFRSNVAVEGQFSGGIVSPIASFEDTDPEALSDRYYEWTGPMVSAGTVADLRVRAQGLIAFSTAAIPDPSPRPAWMEVILGSKHAKREPDGSFSWSTTASKILIADAGILPFRPWTGQEVRLPLDPAGGQVKIRLRAAVETQQVAGETYGMHTYWDAVKFAIIRDDEKAPIDVTRFIVVDAAPAGTVEADLGTFSTGQGPTSETPGAQTLSDGSLAEKYKEGPYGASEPPFEYETGKNLSLEFLRGASVLRQQRADLDVRQDALYVPGVEIGPADVVELGGKRYEAGEHIRYFRSGKSGCELIELRDDAGWPDLTELHDEAGALVSLGSAAARVFELRQAGHLSSLNTLPFTKTTGVHAESPTQHTTLNVDAISADAAKALRTNRYIFVLDRRGGGRNIYRGRLTGDVASGATTLSVEALDESFQPYNPSQGLQFSTKLAPGSGVFMGDRGLVAALAFLEDYLLSLITADVIGYTRAAYDSATPITSMDLESTLGANDGIRYRLEDDAELIIYPLASGGEVGTPVRFLVNNPAGYNVGESPITIDALDGGAVPISAPVGSRVEFSQKAGSRFYQDAKTIEALVFSHDTDVACVINANYSGLPVTSIDVFGLESGVEYYADDTFLVRDGATGQIQRVKLTSNISGNGGAQTLSVASVDLLASVGDSVKVGEAAGLRISNSPSGFRLRVLGPNIIVDTDATIQNVGQDWWIDADGYSLKSNAVYADKNALTFWSAPSGTRDAYIWHHTGSGLEINTLSGGDLVITSAADARITAIDVAELTNGTGQIEIDAAANITIQNAAGSDVDITMTAQRDFLVSTLSGRAKLESGRLELKEVASAVAATAGYGLLYVLDGDDKLYYHHATHGHVDLLGGLVPAITAGRIAVGTGTTITDSQHLYEDATGVGIGTTSPERLFHIQSPGNLFARIKKTVGPDTLDLGIEGHTAVVDYTTTPASNANIEFRTNGVSALTITDNQRVGIAKTDPDVELDVEGIVRATSGAQTVDMRGNFAGAPAIGSFSDHPLLLMENSAEAARLTGGNLWARNDFRLGASGLVLSEVAGDWVFADAVAFNAGLYIEEEASVPSSTLAGKVKLSAFTTSSELWGYSDAKGAMGFSWFASGESFSAGDVLVSQGGSASVRIAASVVNIDANGDITGARDIGARTITMAAGGVLWADARIDMTNDAVLTMDDRATAWSGAPSSGALYWYQQKLWARWATGAPVDLFAAAGVEVTAAAALTDDYLVRGDGGARGVQTNAQWQLTDNGHLYATDVAARFGVGIAPVVAVHAEGAVRASSGAQTVDMRGNFAGAPAVGTFSNHPLLLMENSAEVARLTGGNLWIRNGGKLGVDVNPTYSLHVNGDARILDDTQIDGTVTAFHVSLLDNGKLKLGTSYDAHLAATGSEIELELQGTQAVRFKTLTESMMIWRPNAEVEAYYNGLLRWETSNAGLNWRAASATFTVDVDADLLIDANANNIELKTEGGGRIELDSADDVEIDSGNGIISLTAAVGGITMASYATFALRVTFEGALDIYERTTHPANPDATHLRLYGLNDNRFYYRDSAGTQHKLLTDQDAIGGVDGPGSSTNRAIATWNGTAGDTLRNTGVIIDASNNLELPAAVSLLDSGKLKLGTSYDAHLAATGSEIELELQGTQAVRFKTLTESMMIWRPNAEVEAYYNGLLRWETSNAGLNWRAASATFTVDVDADLLIDANANDIELKTEGAGRIELDSAGDVEIDSGNGTIFLHANEHVDIGRTAGGLLQMVREDSSIASGNMLGRIDFAGDDPADSIGARIEANARESWQTGQLGSSVSVWACPENSSTLNETLRVTARGLLVVGEDADDSLTFLGGKADTGDPTSSDFPSDDTWGFYWNLSSGNAWICINRGGSFRKVAFTT